MALFRLLSLSKKKRTESRGNKGMMPLSDFFPGQPCVIRGGREGASLSRIVGKFQIMI